MFITGKEHSTRHRGTGCEELELCSDRIDLREVRTDPMERGSMSTQNEEAPVSTTDLEALPNPGLLPDSLVELLGAAEDLEDTLDLAKFPDLSGTPSNPEQVERAVLVSCN